MGIDLGTYHSYFSKDILKTESQNVVGLFLLGNLNKIRIVDILYNYYH